MKQVIYSIFFICLSLFLTNTPAFATDANISGEVFELGEVLVSGKGGAVNLATTVTKITDQDIKNQGARTVAEVLELAPGVDMQVGGKGQSQITIRGFQQEDAKVLIDGVPAHETYFGSLDLGMIPADAVARIEITKGASSVLYGANTMGGVINIITKKGGKEPVTQLTTSIGTNEEKNVTVSHGQAVGKFNYWLTYGYQSADDFELSDDFDPNNPTTGIGSEFNEDGDERDLSSYIRRTINTKIGFEPSDATKVYLSFDYHNNERGLPTEYDRYWEFTKWDQWHLNLVGEHSFNDLFTLKARTYYVKHDDTLTDVSWDDDHTTEKKWFEESSYDDYTVGGEIQGYLDFGDKSLLKFGVSYMRDNHKQQDYLDSESRGDEGFSDEEEYEADIYTFSLEDEIRLTEKLAVVIGASLDYYDPQKAYDQPVPDDENTFNPQVGVVYDISNTVSVHGSVGKKTRFPQLKELFSKHTGGNPDLDPQEAITYEIGTTCELNPAITGSLALFYNDIDDKLDTIKMDGEKVNINMGESKIMGMEISLDYAPTRNFFTHLNYTWLDAEEKRDSDSPALDAELMPKHKVNLSSGYTSNFGLGIFVQATWTYDQFEWDGDTRKEIDDYTLVNSKLTYKLAAAKKVDAEIFAEVKNLFDKDYEEYGPSMGRNMLAGVTLTF